MARETRRRSTYTEPERRGSVVKLLIGIVVTVAVIIGGAFAAQQVLGQLNSSPDDYEGSGGDPVTVTIPAGSNGTDIANVLYEADVIASPQAMVDILYANPELDRFQPGSFELRLQMSARAAIEMLQDPASAVVTRVTIPEGFVITQVFERLAEQSGVPVEDFEAAAAEPADYGLPADSVSLEGWLFPATYEVDPGDSAEQILARMVSRMQQELTEQGISAEQAHETLTMAALIQREGRSHEDFTRMARVFYNRLDIDMRLQSDATVAYGTGHLHVVTTTPEERADPENRYNTYVHTGLPPGPIGAPGSDAIRAAVNPAAGDWLYFVTVNPQTGETVFSVTYDEHLQGVARFQEWLRENPSWGS